MTTFVKMMQAKKQVGGEDCGLFAIATATAIAYGADPTIRLVFNQAFVWVILPSAL